MRFVQRVSNLTADLYDLIGSRRMGIDPRLERLSLDVLQRNEPHAIGFADFRRCETAHHWVLKEY